LIAISVDDDEETESVFPFGLCHYGEKFLKNFGEFDYIKASFALPKAIFH
jgi:hypothetical protein